MNVLFSLFVGIVLLCFVAGFVLTMTVNIRATHRTPGYWPAMFGPWASRLAKKGEAGMRARREENETALGRVANRLLQLGTALGILLAIAYGVLRLFGVSIHAL